MCAPPARSPGGTGAFTLDDDRDSVGVSLVVGFTLEGAGGLEVAAARIVVVGCRASTMLRSMALALESGMRPWGLSIGFWSRLEFVCRQQGTLIRRS